MGRRLGQHFLNDPAILDRTVDALAPTPDDVVLEIGPGKGSLTRRLAPRVGAVVAIEKDGVLADALGEWGMGNRERDPLAKVRIVTADALKVDWNELVLAHRTSLSRFPFPVSPSFKVVGNIPYQITSPLIERALAPPLPSVIVMLLQKEVADRLGSAAGAPDYGALTVGVQAVAAVERLFVVKAGAFVPPPRVDSAVVRLIPLSHPLVTEAERPAFRAFVAALFSQRRKQLARSLRDAAGLSRAAAARVLERAAVPGTARVEVLPPATVVEVFRAAR